MTFPEMRLLMAHHVHLGLIGKFIEQGFTAGGAEAILKHTLSVPESLVDLVILKQGKLLPATRATLKRPILVFRVKFPGDWILKFEVWLGIRHGRPVREFPKANYYSGALAIADS
jgi:hypothetical protein